MPPVSVARPRLLDLFCGGGGAAKGYMDAGFDVTGVDIAEQVDYPSGQIVADVMTLDRDWIASFDAIHASPPCQLYSAMTRATSNREHPDLVAPTRVILEHSGRPWVIENVPGAPLRRPIQLCGSMFPPLRVRRHRWFESNMPLLAPKCGEHRPVWSHCTSEHWAAYRAGEIDVTDPDIWLSPVGNFPMFQEHAAAMGLPWMTDRRALAQAIPPPYTQFIGEQILRML